MNLALFIARRLYSNRTDNCKVSRPVITIATLGVAIGLAVMIVSVCVVLGFQAEIRNKLIGFGAHIQVSNMEQTSSFETYPVVGDDSLMHAVKRIPGVKSAQRYITKPGLFKTDDQFRGIALKGVGPEYDFNFLRSHLLEGEVPTFSDSKSSNKIVVSKMIADAMQLKRGDKVYTYFIGTTIRARRFQVVGIYQTNLTEFDKRLVFTDMNTLVKLNNWEKDQVSGVELILNDYKQLPEVYNTVVHKVNRQVDHYGDTYYSQTIEMLYPQLFAWLSLLDMNVWVILVLMLSVAVFTMVSSLLIIILERTNMIGILKALGATNGCVRHVFLYFSALLIGRGLLIGNLIGVGICLLQKYTGLFKLAPETYYVDTVPVLINWGLVVVLNAATLLISIFVLVVPSFMVSRIHPVKSIRFE